MIYKRKNLHTKIPGGFFQFEDQRSKTRLLGYGHGEHIRLRDEFGNLWQGVAEVMHDASIRYTFRDANGRSISGISDSSGIMLRDERGKSWRGFLD